ncbi:LytR/AlgR family response regulator transcription factor [Flammeovirga kamogawensis]|uniref:LytTR family DNA-binding domain-containing protein n=1 Tax=Flammeovirga kamogawensis TaxID=373891 RepID=A0ABX8H104_9BACT|nr:LytTR family DNA-binding domain-containing protein [Flammeovirga kamogawensis]MBB6463286.1 DNA-binding LytR/AlgR family response regulator [Flammeovirga kamogawensis]QWG09564.1 LytTR family DNA-binding domain-containing protein [Flammeovirga kamogawensis]TRX65078.1 response regulator transcription factor [Flammeovirga kamogawensis]
MKVIIIEDEKPAQAKLQRQINKTPFDIEIVKIIDSVDKAIVWLKENQETIDLIFMDIHLTDGIAFDILEGIEVSKPIIFTTAYDEYALDAFKANSIDYLLKPVDADALTKAIQKLQTIRNGSNDTKSGQIDALLATYNQKYKKRFMIRVGEVIKSIETENITLFGAEGRHTFVYTNEGRRYIVDFKMEELTDILDPNEFFRTGRSFIVHRTSIVKINKYTNSRLIVELPIDINKDIVVGREKVKTFKEWLG